MQQKVWVIGEEDWKRPSKPLRPEAAAGGPGSPAAVGAEPELKNPALAFSLSMVIWGSGQLYLREYRRGAAFLAAMLAFWGLAIGLVVSPAPLDRTIAASGHPFLVLTFGILGMLLGLLIWLVSAADAYFLARPAEAGPFAGMENSVWPLLGSLAFPGWGQFLNGQPKKGCFFLLAGLAGLYAAAVIGLSPCLLRLFATGPARLALEWYLVIALVGAPVALLVWLVAVFDANRSCRERYRKRYSLGNVGFRLWSREILRDLTPRATTLLSLALAVSVGMQLLSRKYYLDLLDHVRLEMAHRNLVLLPELAHSIMQLLGH